MRFTKTCLLVDQVEITALLRMEIDYYASNWEVWRFQFSNLLTGCIVFLRGSIECNLEFEREVVVSVWNKDLTSKMHLMHELSRTVLDTSRVLQMNSRKFVRRKLNEIAIRFVSVVLSAENFGGSIQSRTYTVASESRAWVMNECKLSSAICLTIHYTYSFVWFLSRNNLFNMQLNSQGSSKIHSSCMCKFVSILSI